MQGSLDEGLDQATEIFLKRRGTPTQNREEDRRRLQALLTKRGAGSLLRGWRRELDPDGDLEVDFQDYLAAASKMNFYADAQLLFGTDNDSSMLSLEELAPFEGQLVKRFKLWISKKFKGHKELFVALDAAKTAQVAREAWHTALLALGFEGTSDELEALYHLCDVGDAGNIKQEDLIFLEKDPEIRDQEFHRVKVGEMLVWKRAAAQEYIDYKMVKSVDSVPMTAKHRLAPRPWLSKTFEMMPTVMCHRNKERLQDRVRKGRHARITFISHLRELYGNEVRALRRALAPDGYGFSLMTLRNYCRRSNLRIDHRDLWAALDRNHDGQVTLEEFNCHTALALASLQRWARKSPLLGSCAAIWETPEAADASRKRSGTWFSGKKMLVGTLRETLQSLQWPGANNASTRSLVFGALDIANCGLITLADLQWLDRWRPPEWVYAEPDPEALKELREILAEAYGHPLRAWRCILDKDDSNHLDYNEFLAACKQIRFGGNPASAWRALDTDILGRVSMKQYDPESAQLLHSFKAWTEVNFGSVKHFFKAMDTDNNGDVTYPELKRACHKLHWHGDVQLLFDCLDIDRAKDCDKARNLSLAEVAFLDSWLIEPTEEELAAEDSAAEVQKPVPKKTKAAMTAFISRLADPCGEMPSRRKPVTDLSRSGESWSPAQSLHTMRPAMRCADTSQSTRSLPNLRSPTREGSFSASFETFHSPLRIFKQGHLPCAGSPIIVASASGSRIPGL